MARLIPYVSMSNLLFRGWPGLAVFAALLLSLIVPPATTRAQDAPVRLEQAVLELPWLVSDGRLIVPVHILGAGKRFFILDTAASSSVISSGLREHLGLDPSQVRRDTVQGAGGRRVMEKVPLPGIGVGGEVFTDVDPVVLDLSDFRTYDGLAVEGILGTDVLGHYTIEFDASQETIRLHPLDDEAPRGGTAGAEGDGIPFESRTAPGFVEFELPLNGRPVRALLDTGASRSVLNWKAAESAGIRHDDPALRKSARGSHGITGGRTETFFYTFDALDLGPARLDSAEVKIADLAVFQALGIAAGPAMLVGLDLLQACPLTIDYGAGRLDICT